MGYEDRDYFKSKPKFEFASGLHKGTKGLLIGLIAAYVAAIVVSDQLEYAKPEFWAAVAAGNENALLGYQLFVLTPANVIPVGGFEPQHWKLLTHWLVAPGIISAIIDVVMVYMVGKMLEQLLGTKRYLALFVGACVASGLLAALADPWLLGGRTSVIMGPSGGILACLVAPVWIAPRQKSVFGWPLRNVIIGLVAIFAGFALILALTGKDAVISPTQLIWGAAIGAAYMAWLKKRGELPSVDGTQQQEGAEPWEKAEYLTDRDGKPFDERKYLEAAEKQRHEERMEAADRENDKRRLDNILAKISRSGVGSLSRNEKKFLDEQSKKR